MSSDLERRYRRVLRLPRWYAWGQALRRAVLTVLLMHAVLAVDVLVFLIWSRRLVGWLPAPPGSLVIAPAGVWNTAYGPVVSWPRS